MKISLKQVLGMTCLCTFAMTIMAANRGYDEPHGKIPVTTKSEQAYKAYIQGRELNEKLRATEAIAYFREAIELDPDFAMAHLNLAQVLTNNQVALVHFKKAAELADGASAGERLMIQAINAGSVDNDGARQRKLLAELVENYPHDERALNRLALAYFNLPDYQTAIELLQKAEQINPKFSQVQNQLGYCYKNLGDYNRAEAAFKRYIELIPDDPNPYDSYAELMLKIGKFDAALANYRKALSINPDFVLSYRGVAGSLNYQGRHHQARQELEKMLKRAQTNGQKRTALYSMAVSHADEGHLERAVEAILARAKLAKKEKNPWALSGDYGTLAFLYTEMGQFDKARSYDKKSLEVMRAGHLPEAAVKGAEVWSMVTGARLAAAEGDLDGAARLTAEFREHAQAWPAPWKTTNIHDLQGRIALGRKQYKMAIAELEQANVNSSDTMYRLSHAYAALGDQDQANAWRHKAAKDNAYDSLGHSIVRHKMR